MENKEMLKGLLEGFGLNDEESEITALNCCLGNRKLPKSIAHELKKYLPLFC